MARPSLLRMADQVLERQGLLKGGASSESRAAQQAYVTDQEVEKLVGLEYGSISNCDPYIVEGLRQTLVVNRMIENGHIPPTFTKPAICKRCGPVLLDTYCDADLEACPWCFCARSKLPKFS